MSPILGKGIANWGGAILLTLAAAGTFRAWPFLGHARNVPAAESLAQRSEEHTSELQSLMRISYAVFCLKKKTTQMKQKHLNTARHKHKRATNTTTYTHP